VVAHQDLQIAHQEALMTRWGVSADRVSLGIWGVKQSR
jgi:hypothetical protein